jgi:chorismate dehydratase
MQKIKVSPVSYLNTLPMTYGLKNSEVIKMTELSVDTPAECAKKLISGQVDIGLVPVAVIPEICNAQIISKYCIGANGPVRSVVLASQVSLDDITEIVLDPNSRTSVKLIKVIASEFWKKDFKFIAGKQGFEKVDIQGNTAGVVIGDKVFAIEKKYKYIYDLAEIWKSFTNLPFVFAAWVANKPITEEYINLFNQGLSYGIAHVKDAVDNLETDITIDKIDLLHYLQNNLDYLLDDNKNKAINLFLEKCKSLNL